MLHPVTMGIDHGPTMHFPDCNFSTEVRFRREDGRERIWTFVAEFHPVTSALRGIQRLEEDGRDNGSTPLASAP